MPGVRCGLAACWQLLLGLRVSPARGMVRLRNAAGWACLVWLRALKFDSSRELHTFQDFFFFYLILIHLLIYLRSF